MLALVALSTFTMTVLECLSRVAIRTLHVSIIPYFHYPFCNAYFKHEDGKWKKQYVVCTKTFKASTITWWGRRRWQVEGFFKTAKHRFGLHRFGQQTLMGVYKWLVLSLTAYLLTHWAHLHSGGVLPDWGEAAQLAPELLLPLMVLLPLLTEIQRLQPLAKRYGLDINVNWRKI